MRRFLLALALSLPSLTLAAEPRVVVAGPHTATVGTLLMLDVEESVSDPETPLKVSFGKSVIKQPVAKVLTDEGKPSLIRVVASEPGTFYMIVRATGKKDKDSEPSVEELVWPITVTSTPEPSPPPTPGPTPNPTPNPPLPDPQSVGEQLGRTFGPKLAASLADAFDTAATMIAAGTSVSEADNTLKTKFVTGRNDVFKTLVAPEFAKILPEGQEPRDAATRAAFAQIHRDFAKGLRGGQ